MSSRTERPRPFAAAVAATLLAGCVHVPPPASPLPDAAAALDRLAASARCGVAVQASAKIDHFSDKGRFRGDLLLFAASPARLRMDVVSPFGAALATLTSDGHRFALSDLRDRRFIVGAASPCNIARLTSVPLPGHVLVSLLRGQPPLLRDGGGPRALRWSDAGYYVVVLPSTRTATEELHLAPHPDDLSRPWSEQRFRLLAVTVSQYGRLAWKAELEGHRPAPMARPRVDPDGIDPPVPPSGPACTAELPRSLRLQVPDDGEDVVFRYDQVTWNPPLPEGTFLQARPPGLVEEPVDCE